MCLTQYTSRTGGRMDPEKDDLYADLSTVIYTLSLSGKNLQSPFPIIFLFSYKSVHLYLYVGFMNYKPVTSTIA